MHHANPGCDICGSSLEYIRCWGCGGEGDIQVDYGDEWRDSLRCNVCYGRGGWWVCVDAKKHEAGSSIPPETPQNGSGEARRRA